MIFQDFWNNCVVVWEKKAVIFIGDIIGTENSSVVCWLYLKLKEMPNSHWRSVGKKIEKDLP